MHIFFINIFKIILRAIYAVLKIFPLKKTKILFLSRQADTPSIDFSLIQKELKTTNNEVDIVNICCRVNKDIAGYSVFFWNILRSMYHLATVRICVLDSYWPPVSILKHKQDLTVIQIWHSIGKIKKSGYQTLNKPGGRNEKFSKALCMHQNYDIIIAGAKVWNPYYCESFGVTEDKLYNYGLPRINFLINNKDMNKEKIYARYPEFKNKKVICYAPTFRRNAEVKYNDLISKVDFKKYILIIKKHPNDKTILRDKNIYTCDEFQPLEILTICDYLITDYSAIAIEGALLNIKTFYYVYDYEKYIEDNNINIDLLKEMPDCVFKDARELVEKIESGGYNFKAFSEYKKKYLPDKKGNSAKMIADLIIKKLYSTNIKQSMMEQ